MKKLILTAISIMLLASILSAQQLEEEINHWAAQQTKSINANDVVNYLNGDGNRAEGDITFGSESTFNSGITLNSGVSLASTKLNETQFVIAYIDASNSNYGTAIVGTVSGNTITFGSEYIFSTIGNTFNSIATLDDSHIVIAYSGNIGFGTATIGTVSGNSISFGSQYLFTFSRTQYVTVAPLDPTHFVIAYNHDVWNAYSGRALVATVSGNSISYGPISTFNTGKSWYCSAIALDNSRFMVSYYDYDNSGYGTSIIGTISSNTISYGSEYIYNHGASDDNSAVYLDETHFVIAYQDVSNSCKGTAVVGVYSGNTISFGLEYVFNSGINYGCSANALDANRFIVSFGTVGTSIIGTVSGNTISYGSGFVFNSGNIRYSTVSTLNASSFIIAYQDYNSSEFGSAIFGDVESVITTTWNGSTNTDWNTGTNWNGGNVPTSTDDVVIPDVSGTSGNFPWMNASSQCNNLLLEESSQLFINGFVKSTNTTFNVGGNLIVEPNAKLAVQIYQNLNISGNLLLKSNITGSASFMNLGTTSVLGTASMQRYISDSKWHLISSPISDATANIFSGEYLQYYNGSWNDITDGSTALIPVQGYSLWDATKSSTFTFTGNLNNGDQSIAISSTNGGWNLLGNPYPSPIDWSLLDDTYGAVYYWDSENSNYVSWNNGSGTGAQYVPSMQGFWINTASNGTFNITNTERTHNGTTTYYKNRTLPQNYLELQVDGNNYYDRLCININDEASNDFDFQYDAYKLTSPAEAVPQLYSITGNDILSIDVRPPAEVIQLGFQCGEDGNYSFNLNELTDISSAVLEDTKTGTMHNLQNKKYDFEYLTSDDELRFKLHLQITGINDNQKEMFTVYSDKKTIYLKSNEIINKGTVKVLDMTGRTTYKQSINNSSFTKIPANCKTGVYIVMLEDGSNSISKKIIIN